MLVFQDTLESRSASDFYFTITVHLHDLGGGGDESAPPRPGRRGGAYCFDLCRLREAALVLHWPITDTRMGVRRVAMAASFTHCAFSSSLTY